MSETRTITFYGAMAKKYGKKHEFAFSNWHQLLGGLISRFGPQIKEEIRVGKWHLYDGMKKAVNALDVDMLKQRNGALENNTLHLVPATEASSSVVRFIIGVVLIVVGVYFGQAWLVQLGAAMVIGAVAEMLIKQPQANQDRLQDENASSIYNSARNVTTQGGPKPTVYGTIVRASSVVISSDFSSDEVA